jgi:hypothetical protein
MHLRNTDSSDVYHHHNIARQYAQSWAPLSKATHLDELELELDELELEEEEEEEELDEEELQMCGCGMQLRIHPTCIHFSPCCCHMQASMAQSRQDFT